MRSVVLDGPDSWAQTMATEGLIEKFVGLDFADAETVFDRCFSAIQAIKKVLPRNLRACTPAKLAYREQCKLTVLHAEAASAAPDAVMTCSQHYARLQTVTVWLIGMFSGWSIGVGVSPSVLMQPLTRRTSASWMACARSAKWQCRWCHGWRRSLGCRATHPPQ